MASRLYVSHCAFIAFEKSYKRRHCLRYQRSAADAVLLQESIIENEILSLFRHVHASTAFIHCMRTLYTFLLDSHEAVCNAFDGRFYNFEVCFGLYSSNSKGANFGSPETH